MNNTCPNYTSCRLVTTREVLSAEDLRDKYIAVFCKGDDHPWVNCKRFITKSKFDLCPDFVLPDSENSPEEILDQFEEEIINNK